MDLDLTTYYQYVLVVTSLMTMLVVRLTYSSSASPEKDAAAVAAEEEEDGPKPAVDEGAYAAFRRRYLIVYLLMVAGDWLQGPYVYILYKSYGFSKLEIAQLFVMGFGASMITGTFVGALADSMGRKKFSLLYCALYIASCATKHVNDYWVLMLGRVLGGTATSLLFSVFESWLVCAHNARHYGEDRLGSLFSAATFGNSLVAILSGIVGQFVVDQFPSTSGPLIYWGGFTGPFDLASIVLLVGGAILSSTWEENYGERQESNLSMSGLVHAFGILKAQPVVAMVGLSQSFFEGAMYSFVFEWTPALTPEGSEPPYGTIFAIFMVSCMGGSQLVGKVLNFSGNSPQSALPWVFGVSALGLGGVPLDHLLGTSYFAFPGMLLFEVCVGLYFPLMAMLKSQVVPEQHRTAIYNIFRIPLNAIVLFVLLNGFNAQTTFSLCVGLLGLAVPIQLLVRKMMASSR